jgi:hypothetical protein
MISNLIVFEPFLNTKDGKISQGILKEILSYGLRE